MLFSVRSFRVMPVLMTSSHQPNACYTNRAGFGTRGGSYAYLASGVLITAYLLYKQRYCTNALCEREGSPGERNDKMQQKTDAFKKRYTMNYENRIRMYSLPDKIFRYVICNAVIPKPVS